MLENTFLIKDFDIHCTLIILHYNFHGRETHDFSVISFMEKWHPSRNVSIYISWCSHIGPHSSYPFLVNIWMHIKLNFTVCFIENIHKIFLTC